VAFKRPLEEAKFFLVSLFLFFPVLLVLDIFSNFVLIQPNGAHTVSSAPEVVPPVGFLLEQREALE